MSGGRADTSSNDVSGNRNTWEIKVFNTGENI